MFDHSQMINNSLINPHSFTLRTHTHTHNIHTIYIISLSPFHFVILLETICDLVWFVICRQHVVPTCGRQFNSSSKLLMESILKEILTKIFKYYSLIKVFDHKSNPRFVQINVNELQTFLLFILFILLGIEKGMVSNRSYDFINWK
jgi:hypothetical protein